MSSHSAVPQQSSRCARCPNSWTASYDGSHWAAALWQVIVVELESMRWLYVVARARGEGGGLLGENARKEIHPRPCHGERRV